MIQFRCRKHRDPLQQLWQVALADNDALAARPLEGLFKHGLQPGGWIAETRNLSPGLYCQHCLRDGSTEPLADYDEFDIRDAGLTDIPLIGLSAAAFDLDSVWTSLSQRIAPIVATAVDRVSAPPHFDGNFFQDSRVDPELRSTVSRLLKGGQLYRHQAQSIEASLDGSDVIVETATASGKSFCYWIPIANTLLNDNNASALYISPLNALAEDQLRAIDQFGSAPTTHFREGKLPQFYRSVRIGANSFSVARYHGGISNEVKATIRKNKPNVVITNPDMLHYGILPHHSNLWQVFFANLRFIVIDELHVYRGMFGANFANILRRLLRLVERYNVHPQFIACSASIGNPIDLYSAVTGRSAPVLVPASQNGAPIHRQKRVILDLSKTDDAMSTVTKDLMVQTVGKHRARTLAFMRSISEVDQVYRYVSGELSRTFKGLGKTALREYKREIPVDQKARVTADLKNGATLGVISTTALQLGIDIGDLSVAIIAKFPGSKAAFFQQSGRVGRNGDSLVFFLADRSPLDQWFAQRPDELLKALSEVVFINPNHRETVLNHLRCAAEELPIDLQRDHKYWGPDLPKLLEELAARGGMSPDGREVLVIRRRGEAAKDVSIRSLGFECVVRDDAGDEVARPDVLRAMRRFHKYARFQIQDQAYEVYRLSVNWDERAAEAVARRLDRLEYSTASVVKTSCSILAKSEHRPIGDYQLECGSVRFTVNVLSYYKIPTSGSGEPQFQPLGIAAPPHYELETHGLWIHFVGASLTDLEESDRAGAVKSAIESLRIAAALLCSTDPDDIATHVQENQDKAQFIGFLADTEPGGNGLTAHVFIRLESLVDGALRILKECPNCRYKPESRGCPSCVTTPWGADDDVYRLGGITLLEYLRDHL